MYKCDCCGKILKKKHSLRGYILCSKHMHQLFKYGKFLDTIQRTNKDLNDYQIDGDITYIHCYNQKNEYINDFIIDTCCLDIIKYHKWRLNQNYPVTGFGINQHCVTYYLMHPKANQVVDHINGNTLDNRLCNLRIYTQQYNVLNKSVNNSNTKYTGVFLDKRRKYKRFCVEIHYHQKKLSLGNYRELAQAIYTRYIAEVIIFKEYRNTNDDINKFQIFDDIPIAARFNIIQYVINKIIHKNFLR